MADVVLQPNRAAGARPTRKRSSLHAALKRKSTAAFLMTLPLILLVAILVLYPAFYSLHLATLNKSMQRFVGLGNFEFHPGSGANEANVARRHSGVLAAVVASLCRLRTSDGRTWLSRW